MRPTARVLLASASVALITGVVWLAVVLGPSQGRFLLVGCGVLAMATAVQSVTAAPEDLTLAVLFTLLPLLALLEEGSPTWMIGPLGVFLLLAAELNALSWDARGPFSYTAAQRRRLVDSLILTTVGSSGVLIVRLVEDGPLPTGTWAVVLAGVTLGALAHVVLTGPGRPASPEAEDASLESNRSE
jgi:hypothetical protein